MLKQRIKFYISNLIELKRIEKEQLNAVYTDYRSKKETTLIQVELYPSPCR